MRKKAIVYGAGFFGFSLALKDGEIPYEIMYYIDRDIKKIGGKVAGYEIKPLEDLMDESADVLIIAMDEWRPIIAKVKEMNFTKEILIYDINEKEILGIEKKIRNEIINRVNRIEMIHGVKTELIMEAYDDGEFNNVDAVCILGKLEDCNLIKSFLNATCPELSVSINNEFDRTKKKTKWVFCGLDYLEQYKKAIYGKDEWCIIPLFDVERAINI